MILFMMFVVVVNLICIEGSFGPFGVSPLLMTGILRGGCFGKYSGCKSKISHTKYKNVTLAFGEEVGYTNAGV